MTGAEFCVLCASGEHRPESHNVRTTTLGHAVLGDDEVLVAVVEHYRIVDERLPYAERFHIERYTLEVSKGDGDERVALVDIRRDDALRLAQAFLTSALEMK